MIYSLVLFLTFVNMYNTKTYLNAKINCHHLQCNPCKYGYELDLNGCKTCNCVNPCKYYRCLFGEQCLSEPVYCYDGSLCGGKAKSKCNCIYFLCVSSSLLFTRCFPSFSNIFTSCQSNACPNVKCLNCCTYGHVVVNGCKTCKCVDPCKDIQCPRPKVCVPNPYDCSPDGSCLAETKCVPNCPLFKCRLCPYGYEVDGYGCQTCECVDPCKNHKCNYDEQCNVQLVSTRDDFSSGYKTICTKICKKLNCPMLKCKYGFEEDCNHCPICKCREPCRDVICPRYYYCIVQTIFCFVAPCPPPFPICVNYCKKGYLLIDDYGFPITCSSQRCPKGTKICSKLDCPSLKCRYGFEEDCNNCPICKCREPCQNVICPQYYYCIVETIFCVIAPCPPPLPVCEHYCKEGNLLIDNYGFPVTCSSQQCPKHYTCTIVPAAKKSYCCSCSSE
ncbi:hypothetical protein RN001_001412 [Aquatica leii]|uniref:Antistasin-like domain-containing protein n=1 Tax=Aquatica leii TaxID=1421715 RepID=A0AAN7PNI6_9COLE|nr:hypothetical protein RN001_001412 [Aquatica leii]